MEPSISGRPWLRAARARLRDARRRAPSAVTQAEPGRLLEHFAATLPGVIFGLVMAPDGSLSLHYASAGTRELFGIEPDALVSDFDLVLGAVHPQDRDDLLESLRESAATLERWDWRGRAFAADGGLRQLHGIAQPIRTPDGATVWDGVLLDDTESWWEQAIEGAMRRRLQLIIEHLPAAAVALYDRDLRLCFCEGQLFAHLDMASMLGRRLPDIIEGDALDVVLPGIEAALAGEPAAPVVLERDSRGRPLAINFAPYRLADGRIDGAIVHWQDVSELRAVERARRQAEARFGRAFEDAPIGMALVGLDGQWIRVNRALCQTVGYSEEELLATAFPDITHPEDVDADIEQLRQVVAGERRSYQIEKRYLHKDGHTVWVRLSASLLHDDAGLPLHFVSQIEDISERRRAEQQLAQARAEIDRFFELSLELMAIINDEGYFVRLNPAFERALGYSDTELLSRPFLHFVHPDDLASTLELFRGMGEGRRAQVFENRYRCADGSYRWLQWSATALEDGFSYAVARDVSERREMEQRLRESREQALAASRMKSEFVANMSHEIRTPLNGVVSMTELLLDTELTEEQREYAQVTVTSAHALTRVIDDILDFSKIEAGKLEIVREDFELERVIGEVCEMLSTRAHEKGLELAYAIDAALPRTLSGDSGRLRQVLLNLAGNAVKFTSRGEVTLRAQLAEEPGGRPGLRIEVCDTGIGIGPEQLRALFQPFSQADATTTRRYGGTGLGLSIAKQLVELMDGEIGVHSIPGAGSTFWVQFPCEPGHAAEPEPAARDLTGIRVLIVDDNATGRLGLEQQTASWGMIPHGAEDGRTALALLRNAAAAGRPFEVALVDHELPDTDGAALAAEIARSPRLRSTRLLILSPVPLDGEPLRALGVSAVLSKPARASRLYDQLVRALEGARGGRPTPMPRLLPRPHRARGLVLVAEDNEINQFVAVRMLQKLGYAVDLAAHGREAVALAGSGQYAAVFMDCQMPELDGYEATAVIRAAEGSGRRTPIIAMTANTMAGDRERCLAAGMDDYLPKPLVYERVAAVCERWMAGAPVLLATSGKSPRGDRGPVGAGDAGGVFDPGVLAAMVRGPQVAQLLTLFLEQLDAGLDELRTAVGAGDPEPVHRGAHRLKGAAATIGAAALAEACQGLCAAARAEELAALPALHERLEHVAAGSRAAIEAHLVALANEAA